MVGIRDSFGCSSADYPSLLEHFGLTAAAITDAVKGLLS
jgi:transketolase C-terminal domain/subunit